MDEQKRRNLDRDPCYVRVHVEAPARYADHERESGLTDEGEAVLDELLEKAGFILDDGPHYVGNVARASPRREVGH